MVELAITLAAVAVVAAAVDVDAAIVGIVGVEDANA